MCEGRRRKRQTGSTGKQKVMCLCENEETSNEIDRRVKAVGGRGQCFKGHFSLTLMFEHA